MASSMFLSERRARERFHSSQDKESPPFSKAQIAVLFSRIEHDVMAFAIELDELPVINPSCDASDNPSVHIENITT